MAESPTVLDALEAWLGSRPTRTVLEKLTLHELDDLAELLGELWEAQAEGRIATDASLLGGWTSAAWSEAVFRPELSDSLLYYPSLVVLDPLADFFADRSVLQEMHGIRYRRPDGRDNTLVTGPRMWSEQGSYREMRTDPSAATTRFATIVDNLYTLEEPIRGGVLILRSQWPVLARRREQIAAGVRHDIGSASMQGFVNDIASAQIGPTVWDNLQGLSVELNLPVRPADARWKAEPAFYYLNKTLALADASGAQYVPSTQVDLDLLTLKVNLGVRRVHPASLLREVARLVAPAVDVPIREAVALRRSSEDFEAWRREIQRFGRSASADTPEELRERVEDELSPKIDAVRRAMARSTFAHSVRTDGATVVISGAIAAGAALATNQSSSSAVINGAAVSLTGSVGWVVRAYTRRKPHGANAVLTTLLKK